MAERATNETRATPFVIGIDRGRAEEKFHLPRSKVSTFLRVRPADRAAAVAQAAGKKIVSALEGARPRSPQSHYHGELAYRCAYE